jgi:hypothetical protein
MMMMIIIIIIIIIRNMKCLVIPVIIGVTGIVSKSLSIDSLQKLGTSHIIRKVLQAET